MTRLSPLPLSLTLGAVALCAPTLKAQEAQNVLLIIADDLGREVLSLYNSAVEYKAHTPNLDALAQRGVVFDNFWAAPLSSPARAAMLTGRYGHNTGILSLDVTLPLSEKTIFESLPKECSTGLFGKWHLSQTEQFAADYGIDYFAGFASGGGVRDYNGWRFTEGGQTSFSDQYITEVITSSALRWIEKQSTEWLCVVAYNTPHTPYHLPPAHMHSYDDLSSDPQSIEENPLPYYLAMVESLDYELGRLLEGVDDSTLVIFVGDNGTERVVLQRPYRQRQGKGTLYESGIAAPMIVAGAGVNAVASRNSEPVSAVDLYPTILELLGARSPGRNIDGVSFAQTFGGEPSVREYNFSEILSARQGYMNALSDGEYKIISSAEQTLMFFNIAKDPYERDNLLLKNLTSEDQSALSALEEALKEMKIPKISTPTTKGRNSEREERQGGRNESKNSDVMQSTRNVSNTQSTSRINERTSRWETR